MFEYTSPAVNTTRQIIATIILVCLALIFVGYYVPTVSRFYEESKVAKNLFDFIGYTLVLTVAILDLLHAGKANEYRKEMTESNTRIAEANTKIAEYSKQNALLQANKVALEAQNLDLQQKINQVRLFVTARPDERNELKLHVSNLSAFDLWLTRVELNVAEIDDGTPDVRQLIDSPRRISAGLTEKEYLLIGRLMEINKNRMQTLRAKFYVEVDATGLEKQVVTVRSPLYRFTFNPKKLEEL